LIAGDMIRVAAEGEGAMLLHNGRRLSSS